MPNKKVVLSKNAEEVAKARYFNDGEDWEACSRRVAEAVASIEKDKAEYSEKFGEMIYKMDFLPAGRILRNASRSKGSMLNCFVLPIGDSIEEIGGIGDRGAGHLFPLFRIKRRLIATRPQIMRQDVFHG